MDADAQAQADRERREINDDATQSKQHLFEDMSKHNQELKHKFDRLLNDFNEVCSVGSIGVYVLCYVGTYWRLCIYVPFFLLLFFFLLSSELLNP